MRHFFRWRIVFLKRHAGWFSHNIAPVDPCGVQTISSQAAEVLREQAQRPVAEEF
jgi:hypothetical protein